MLDTLMTTLWIQQVGILVGALLMGVFTQKVVVAIAHRIAKATESTWDDLLVESIRGMPVIWWLSAGVWVASQRSDLALAEVLEKVLIVVVIGSITVVGMRLASGGIDRYAAQSGRRLPSTTLVNNVFRMLVGMMGIALILQNLEIQITPLLTALGVGGLAVALALQDTLGNLFAGVSVILSGQVQPGHYVRLASGEEGFVTDVKARNTTIRTFPAENLVVVPNSILASNIVTNYSLPLQTLWMSVAVGVSYASNLEEVERITLEVAAETVEQLAGGVSGDVPRVRYSGFGDSSIDFEVILPVQQFTDQFVIRHDFIKRLHKRYNAEEIEIPFPIRTIYMQKSD